MPSDVEKNTSSTSTLKHVVNTNVTNINISRAEFASLYSSDITIAKPVENTQDWLPESNPPPFPDCSVVSHSSMVVTMPTSMTFEFMAPDGNEDEDLYEDDYYDPDANNFMDSACDDHFFLGKVHKHLEL